MWLKKKVAKRNVQSLAVSNHVQDLTMFYFRLRKWVDTIPYIFFNHSNLVEYVTYLISYVRMTLFYRKMENRSLTNNYNPRGGALS